MKETPTHKKPEMALTYNEKLMIADLCNGWIYPHSGDLDEVEKAAKDRRGYRPEPVVFRRSDGTLATEGDFVLSGLESAILDGCNRSLEGERTLDEKWGIDAVTLIAKIRMMSCSERALLLVGVRVACEQEREHPSRFEEVLRALPI